LSVQRIVLALLAFSHALAATGYPLPNTQTAARGAGPAYPCQNRPCGCISARECWKGDCCCFTLEEKLRWAIANGIEPPVHVRPLVEARQSQHLKQQIEKCCLAKTSSESSPTVRWVAGFYAQKCRGEGPAGLFQLEPAIIADPIEAGNYALQSTAWDVLLEHQHIYINFQPPTPPPRHI